MKADLYLALAGQQKAELTCDEQALNRIYDGADLTVRFAGEIAASPYSGDAWAWIQARITAGDFRGLRIGDYIPFALSSKTYRAQIAGINTYKGFGDPVIGNHIDFITKEVFATAHKMNQVNFNNGTKFGDAAATEYPWLASDMYLWLNSKSGTIASETVVKGGSGTAVDYTSAGVYDNLPSELKSVIVEKRAFAQRRYSASGLLNDDNAGGWTNIGKIWLPSEIEVFGRPCWGGKGGFPVMGYLQYPIFANGSGCLKYAAGTERANWWLLTTYSSNATAWCYVNGTGPANAESATTAHRVPICFRIA